MTAATALPLRIVLVPGRPHRRRRLGLRQLAEGLLYAAVPFSLPGSV